MADIGAKAPGPAVEEEGERFQPLAPFPAKLGAMNLDLAGVRVSALPDRLQSSSRNNVEGLLPAGLLRKYEVVFDYPAHQFTLAKPGSIEPKGVKVASPISKESGFPRIELQVAGANYGFLLDTGASFTMISRVVLESWAKTNPAWPTSTGAVGFANMFGGDMENGALMLRLPQLSIGPIIVTKVGAVSREEGTCEKWVERHDDRSDCGGARAQARPRQQSSRQDAQTEGLSSIRVRSVWDTKVRNVSSVGSHIYFQAFWTVSSPTK